MAGALESIYRLTPLQEGILFHVLRSPGTGLYHEQVTGRTAGGLDREAFRRAWQQTVDRHPALRTLFTWERRDRPLQVVLRSAELPWTELDWRDRPAADHERAVRTFLHDDRDRGFELDRAPLMRCALIRLTDHDHLFAWSFHHLLLDGWSARLVLREVSRRYASSVRGERLRLPPAPAFEAYVAWIGTLDLHGAEEHWRCELDGFEGATSFRVDAASREIAPDPGSTHREHRAALGQDTAAALVSVARERGLTLATMVHGAWALTASAYSGADDVVVGSTSSGRTCPIPRVDETVGLLVNTLPLRARVEPDRPAADWLRDLQERLARCLRFEHTPLPEVRRWCGAAPDEPLFDSVVVVENLPGDDDPLLGDIRFHERSDFPLALLATPGDPLELTLIHRTDRFDAATAALLLRRTTAILERFAADPELPAGTLARPSPEEHRVVAGFWSGGGDGPPADRTVVDQLIDAVRATPDAPALAWDDGSLSYRRLEEAVEHNARSLRGRGAARGAIVGVVAPRRPETVVAMLATTRAGAAYLPLDPELPPARLHEILRAASVGLVTGPASALRRLPPCDAELVPCELDPGPTPDSWPPAWEAPGPDHTAYLLSTSGSSGRPKQVVVSHRNLAHSTLARPRVYPDAPERFLMLPPFAFDSSVAGLYWTLLAGGTLCLPPSGAELDASRLASAIARWNITHTLLLPSLYALLLELADPSLLGSLRTVIVAGERCPSELARRHHRALPDVALYNEYGPTEATVWATVHAVAADHDGGAVPIGRPIPGTRTWVVDRDLHPVGVGVPGELVVGGPGVAAGYLDRPEETAAHFLPHDPDGGGPAYRTGDLVRWRIDGDLEFLGRIDSQVKLRGHRIEPAGVEALLRQLPAVADCAVAVVGGVTTTAGLPPDRPVERTTAPEPRDGTLAAFVQLRAGHELDHAALRGHLAEHLPAYAVPSVVVRLDELPRTRTGKLDRRALARHPLHGPRPVAPAARAASSAEQDLAEIWTELLGLEDVGPGDDFFALGGTSILTVRLVARARRRGLELTPEMVFEHPTLAALAAAAGAGETVTTGAHPRPQVAGRSRRPQD